MTYNIDWQYKTTSSNISRELIPKITIYNKGGQYDSESSNIIQSIYLRTKKPPRNINRQAGEIFHINSNSSATGLSIFFKSTSTSLLTGGTFS